MTTYMNIGVSGLRAAQLGLLTTQHNIANANTPGYSRQGALQATGFAVNSGDGALGQGVKIETIKRNYSDFLTAQYTQSQSRLSELETQYANLSQMDNLLADQEAGLSPALRDFFASVQQVASSPSLIPARQAMIASAQTLASRFQLLDGRFESLATQANGRISSAVSSINALTTSIGELNQNIVLAQSAYGQPANDLLDQRDSLVNELNKLVGVSTSDNRDGTINVFFGSGQQLVVGAQVATLVAQEKAADSSKMGVAIQYPGGNLELADSFLTGGELGALVAFRNGALENARSALSDIAEGVAQAMNNQQAVGMDLNGRIAGEPGFESQLFTIPATSIPGNAARDIRVNPFVVDDPRLIAAASPVRTSQAVTNTGTLKLELSGVTAPYSSATVNLTVNAAQQLTGFAGDWTATYSSGAPASGTGGGIALDNGSGALRELTVNGMRFTVTGVGNTGDAMTIERNAGGVQDGRNAALMAGLQTEKIMYGGTATFNASYAAIVADTGIVTRETKIRLDAQSTLHYQIEGARDTISGVNLDEEAANLLKFQQAYQASAKALQIGVDLFEQLLSIR